MLLPSDRPVSPSVRDALLPVDYNILNFSYQVLLLAFPVYVLTLNIHKMCLTICLTWFMYISILLEFWVFFFPLCLCFTLKLELTSLIAHLIKNLPAVWETWVRFLGWEDPLEKEMATHSSVLAWRIPWTEEPGGLLSMWSQESDMLSD